MLADLLERIAPGPLELLKNWLLANAGRPRGRHRAVTAQVGR